MNLAREYVGGLEKIMVERLEFEVEAEDEKEALKKAEEHFQQKTEVEIKPAEIEIDLLEEDKGFLGFFGGKKIYQARVEFEE